MEASFSSSSTSLVLYRASASSSHRVPLLVNHKFKDFKKKGLKHYDLLGRLFNSNTATGFLQISSAQPAPNSDKERELDATFLSSRVHVNINTDSVDDVEELPTPSEAQSWRQAEKRPLNHLIQAEKGRNGTPLKA